MAQDLIFDWNRTDDQAKVFPKVEICDETLRDGIQSPSVHDPSIEDKLAMVALMEKLSITTADIGLPGAGPRAIKDVLAIAKFVQEQKFKLKLNCAARTLAQDIEPIARIVQQVGIPIEVYCFLGASPIRQLVRIGGSSG